MAQATERVERYVRDIGQPRAAADALKSMLAGKIASIVRDRAMTTRAAEARTGFAAADFSRIKRAKLDRFTIDRLMAILASVEPDSAISVSIRSRPRRDAAIAKLKEIEPAIRSEGVSALYLYGSVARDDATADSDVDVFVEYEPDSQFTLLNLVGIKLAIEEALDTDAHVTTRDALRPEYRDVIEQDAIRVF